MIKMKDQDGREIITGDEFRTTLDDQLCNLGLDDRDGEEEW
jgi:hypothetical protein